MAKDTFQALKCCFPLDVNDVASDCGWLPVVQLFSRRGMQMAQIGAYLAWIAGSFLIPHEYLGNLVSSLDCDDPGCSGERGLGPANTTLPLQIC